MDDSKYKVLTIITEASLEHEIIHDLEKVGAKGYTITNARGKGHRGVRDALWDMSANIRIEVICEASMVDDLTSHISERYYQDYAMIMFVSDVEVLRKEKFKSSP